jgi:hypothetical protein
MTEENDRDEHEDAHGGACQRSPTLREQISHVTNNSRALPGERADDLAGGEQLRLRPNTGNVPRRDPPRGLLHEYYRAAAASEPGFDTLQTAAALSAAAAACGRAASAR